MNGVAEDKEWGFIRETENYQDDHGVTDVTSVDLRCFQLKSGGSAATATLAAGGTLGFIADQGPRVLIIRVQFSHGQDSRRQND